MENRKQHYWLAACVLVFATLGSGLSNVNAGIITTGCVNTNVACTLAELSAGADLVINDVNFFGWSVVDQSSNPLGLDDISVMAIDNQPSEVGLAFETANSFNTTGLDLVDITINFAVATAVGAKQVNGASFELTDFSFEATNIGGFISGFDAIFDLTGVLIGDAFAQVDNLAAPVIDTFDSATFAPRSALSVEKLILLGGDAEEDRVSLNGFEQRFILASVPMPTTLLLFITGLFGLICCRRSKSNSSASRF